jgi:hypothetical protein
VRTLLGDRRTTASPVDSTGTYDEAALAREAGLWAGTEGSRLRFLAPRRLLVEKTERGARRGEVRYFRDGRDLSLGLFLSRLYNSFADLLRPRGSCLCRARRPRAPSARGEPAFRPGQGS